MTDRLFGSAETTTTNVGVADIYVDGSSRYVQLISPVGTSSLIQKPTFRFRFMSAANLDLQIQVASDAAFTTIVDSTTLLNQPPLTILSWQMTVNLTTGVLYYWRVRAGTANLPPLPDPAPGSGLAHDALIQDSTANVPRNAQGADGSGTANDATVTGDTANWWGPWSSSTVQYFAGGGGYRFVDMNVGAALVAGKDEYGLVQLNVGATLTAGKDEYGLVQLNVGVGLTPSHDEYAYVWLGDVTTDQPDPWIWFTVPTSGRPGDGVTIYGMGFGDTQVMYSGLVQVNLNDGNGWVNASVVTWQTFPADPDMYTANRELSATKQDPQHGEIAIVIPAEATPPGMTVRVVTT